MRRHLRLAMVLVGALAPAATQASAFLINFESPTYTADTSLFGVDGWGVFNSPSSLVTPGTGVPNVLAGSQSVAVINPGLYKHTFQIPAGPLPSAITNQWLQQVPSGDFSQFYPSDNLAGGGTPLGVQATGGGTFTLFGSGGISNAGAPAVAGNTYLVEMEINFSIPNPNFQGYATNLTTAGPRTFIGSAASAHSYTAASVFQSANGGFFVGKANAGATYFDNFEVLVPEPASLALLAIGAACTLRRARSV